MTLTLVPRFVVATALLVAAPGCGGAPASPTPPAPPVVIISGTLTGAGDIAVCGVPGAEATAKLLDSMSGTVFTAGDNVYKVGSQAEFDQCYDPTWGRHPSALQLRIICHPRRTAVVVCSVRVRC